MVRRKWLTDSERQFTVKEKIRKTVVMLFGLLLQLNKKEAVFGDSLFLLLRSEKLIFRGVT